MTPENRDHLVLQLRQMLLIRRFEEKSAELYTAEKIRGFLHLYIGEEAVAVGVMAALTADDAVVATYREHGQALARHAQRQQGGSTSGRQMVLSLSCDSVCRACLHVSYAPLQHFRRFPCQ